MTDPTALPNLPGFGSTPPTVGEAPPEPALSERLMEALTALELDPSIDSDGDITFTFQDQQLFIRASDDEAQVLRLFGQWRPSRCRRIGWSDSAPAMTSTSPST